MNRRTPPSRPERHAAPPGPGDVLRGRVVAGRREAAGFIALPRVRALLEERLGILPYPGTLNLRLAEAASRDLWSAVRRGSNGFELPPPDSGFCSAVCFPVRVNGSVQGAIVLPRVEGYPSDQVEVVAGENLRERFGLADGDLCTLELEGPGAAPGARSRAG